MLLTILAATMFISALSLVSAGLLSIWPRILRQGVPVLVALAAGTMIGTSFLSLLPESLHLLPATTVAWLMLGAFVAFLFLEKVLRLHHCHDEDCETNTTVGYLNLIGDAVHNFVDGMVIAASFLVSPALGVAATIAVAAHELPQEIGDFGVLIHSGFSRTKALLANFGVALSAVAGALTGWFLTQQIEVLSSYLLPIAAGIFLYIAAVDLVPEIHKRLSRKEAVVLLAFFLLGIAIIPAVGSFLPEHSHSHAAPSEMHTEEDHDHIQHEETDPDHVKAEITTDTHQEPTAETDHGHDDSPDDHHDES